MQGEYKFPGVLTVELDFSLTAPSSTQLFSSITVPTLPSLPLPPLPKLMVTNLWLSSSPSTNRFSSHKTADAQDRYAGGQVSGKTRLCAWGWTCFKIIMCNSHGPHSGVGKTSMVAKLMNPEKEMTNYIPATMGIEFGTQVMNTASSGRVKAQLWDTAGQERFARVLLPTYFRRAKGVILVYDITSARSFESVGERWMKQMEEHTKVEDLSMVS